MRQSYSFRPSIPSKSSLNPHFDHAGDALRYEYNPEPMRGAVPVAQDNRPYKEYYTRPSLQSLLPAITVSVTKIAVRQLLSAEIDVLHRAFARSVRIRKVLRR